jgi:hypothetical protein
MDGWSFKSSQGWAGENRTLLRKTFMFLQANPGPRQGKSVEADAATQQIVLAGNYDF